MNAITTSLVANLNLAFDIDYQAPVADGVTGVAYASNDFKVYMTVARLDNPEMAKLISATLKKGSMILKAIGLLTVELLDGGVQPEALEIPELKTFVNSFDKPTTVFSSVIRDVFKHIGKSGRVINVTFITADNVMHSMTVLDTSDEMSVAQAQHLMSGAYFQELFTNNGDVVTAAFENNPDLIKDIELLHDQEVAA